MAVVLAVTIPLTLYWFVYSKRRVSAWDHHAHAVLGAVATQFAANIEAAERIYERARGNSRLLRTISSGRQGPPRKERRALREGHPIEIVDGEPFLRLRSRGRPDWIEPVAPLVPHDIAEQQFAGLLVLDAQELRLLVANRALPYLPIGMPVELRSPEGGVVDPALIAGSGATREEPKDDKNQAQIRDRLLGLDDVPTVVLGGRHYSLFATRVRHQPDDPSLRSADFIVVALQEADRRQAHALALSPLTRSLIFALAVLPFLALPYVKIRFMGRRERLRRRDLWLLAMASFAASGLATIFVLQWDAYAAMREQMDRDLTILTEQVRKQVRTEVTSALQELIASAPRLASNRSTVEQGVLKERAFDHYPLFEALFVTDQTKQIGKWMPRAVATERVEVKHYAWFSDALRLTPLSTPYFVPSADCGVMPTSLPASGGQMSVPRKEGGDAKVSKAQLDDLCADGGVPFVLSGLFTSTTGLDVAVLALPASIQRGGMRFGVNVSEGARNGTVAIIMEPASLDDPVVPEPFEFAVVDRSGQSIFRSGSQAHRWENLFRDLPDLPRLVEKSRTQIVGEGRPVPEPESMRYRGRNIRMTATPLWIEGDRVSDETIVAFYDTDVVGAAMTRATRTALAWLAALTGVLLITGVLGRRFGSPLEEIWPSRERSAEYLWVCAMLLVTAGIWIATRLVTAWFSVPAVFAYFYLAFAPVALLAFRFSRWRRLGEVDAHRLYPHSYVAAGVLALLALSALPAGVAFQDAWRSEQAAFEHWVARRYAIASRHREQRLEARYRRISGTAAGLATDSVIPVPENLWRTVEGKYKEWATYSLPPPLEGRPVAGGSAAPTCTAMAGFDRSRLPAHFFSLALADCWPRRDRVPELDAASADALQAKPRPLRTSPWARGLRTGIPILLLAGVLWMFVRSVATRILGLPLEGDGVRDASGAVPRPHGQRWLLLRPLRQTIEKLQAIVGPTGIVDLADPLRAADALDPNRDGSKPVLIRSLEAVLDDSAVREALLRFLGAPRAGSVFVETAIDPLHFLSKRLHDGIEESGVRSGEVSRWSAVLGGFEKLRFAVPARKDDADQAEVQLEERLRGCGWTEAEVASLRAWLAEECRWDDRLLEIRGELLRRWSTMDERFLNELKRRAVVAEEVRDAAQAHYRALWSLCSIEEKLVMIHLAQEGLANPACGDVLQRLRRRRLVRVDPRFQLRSASFRRFVLDAESAQTVRSWESPAGEATSARIRGPLGALALVVLALLLFTQGQEVTDALGLAMAAAATLRSFGGFAQLLPGSRPIV